MVAKMMRWRPWPPLTSKKYEVKLLIERLEGEKLDEGRYKVEVKWKGSHKGIGLSSLRRSILKRNLTKEGGVCDDGVVLWNEEFRNMCSFSVYKENDFHPWEVLFTVFNGPNQGSKSEFHRIGTASLNLAKFSSALEKELKIKVPLTLSTGNSDSCPLISLSLCLWEFRTTQEPSEAVQRSIVPLSSSPLSAEALSDEKEDTSALKAGLKKVKIFKEYVSSRRDKKACCDEEVRNRNYAAISEGCEWNFPFEMDSFDNFEGAEAEEGKEEANILQSFEYGTLVHANFAGGSFCPHTMSNNDWVYYSNRKPDAECLPIGSSASEPEPSLRQNSKLGFLSWRKRKLSFRSPKAKGEPLLKKDCAEEGGDDIDFDRRQLGSSDESSFGWHKTEDGSSTNRSSISDFGDDIFAVGCWENKQIVSRDGHMKLQAQVFFASIDQRSERAAGESACTALVAVVADWFQNNRGEMPIKSQFDSLIREGSLEWRNLCANETYMERFPDKHFDLETVLQAKVRSLSVVPQKSFIGFFHPEGLEGKEGHAGFDFLHGAMSFDDIWDEVSRHGSNCHVDTDPVVYIVSWNDHFFLLKVERDAYYILDTLGERLYEGCNQAYILKFDNDTTIERINKETQAPAEKKACGNGHHSTSAEASVDETPERVPKDNRATDEAENGPQLALAYGTKIEDLIVCRGKESCKEYIKSFLAEIPIRELQADIRKGLLASTPLLHRLQIEFHYTGAFPQVVGFSAEESNADAAHMALSMLV